MNELVDKQADAGLRELALFAGAGGGILGGHLLGWRTICAVEWEPYPASVLISRQNDGILPPFPVWDDVQTFDGRPWRGRVDVISGGFPCQDISCAGKGAGIDGDRSSMWSHMARIIGEVRPGKVLVENSPMLVGRGLARVLGDLAQMGYDAEWGVLGAHHVAAPHKRDRIWLMAHSKEFRARNEREDIRATSGKINASHNAGGSGGGDDKSEDGQYVGNANDHGLAATEVKRGSSERSNGSQTREKQASESARSGEQHGQLANASMRRREEQRQESEQAGDAGQQGADVPDTGSLGGKAGIPAKAEGQEGNARKPVHSDRESGGWPGSMPWWATEPDVGRVAHGVAARVDRLKAIGNGQVPAVAVLAWETLTNPKP